MVYPRSPGRSVTKSLLLELLCCLFLITFQHIHAGFIYYAHLTLAVFQGSKLVKTQRTLHKGDNPAYLLLHELWEEWSGHGQSKLCKYGVKIIYRYKAIEMGVKGHESFLQVHIVFSHLKERGKYDRNWYYFVLFLCGT